MIALLDVVRKLGEEEIVVLAGNFDGCVGSNAEGYESQHGGYGYGMSNKEGERILAFCAVMNLTRGNTLSKKRASHLTFMSPF